MFGKEGTKRAHKNVTKCETLYHEANLRSYGTLFTYPKGMKATWSHDDHVDLLRRSSACYHKRLESRKGILFLENFYSQPRDGIDSWQETLAVRPSLCDDTLRTQIFLMHIIICQQKWQTIKRRASVIGTAFKYRSVHLKTEPKLKRERKAWASSTLQRGWTSRFDTQTKTKYMGNFYCAACGHRPDFMAMTI